MRAPGRRCEQRLADKFESLDFLIASNYKFFDEFEFFDFFDCLKMTNFEQIWLFSTFWLPQDLRTRPDIGLNFVFFVLKISQNQDFWETFSFCATRFRTQAVGFLDNLLLLYDT